VISEWKGVRHRSLFTDHHSQLASGLTQRQLTPTHLSSVLDLNHILLFIACIWPLLLLAQTWTRGALNRG
jgi:hypothetical protein